MKGRGSIKTQGIIMILEIRVIDICSRQTQIGGEMKIQTDMKTNIKPRKNN
jgi:hypothetical protein